MPKIKVGLVQINAAFSDQHYFPYSVGILQAYAERHLPNVKDFDFLLPIYRRLPVVAAADQLESVRAVFFSTYVWNKDWSLRTAAELKRRKPETLVVFGGPQVPQHNRPWEIEEFFAANQQVDLAVHGAGEKPFTAVLEHGLSGNWGKIPSVSFRLGNPLFQASELESGFKTLPIAGIRQTAQAPAFTDLSEVPLPYTAGTFDQLMQANPEEKWIGMLETDRNCPFRCKFCGWGLLGKKPVYWPLEVVYQVFDWLGDKQILFVFCANANFFQTKRDLDIARYVVKTKAEKGFPKFLSVQDAKNSPERVFEGRMIMQQAGLNTGVVIALQSVDPETLELSGRANIKSDVYRDLQYRYRAEGIETVTDVILPLAGQTYDTFADGISMIIDWGQHNRIQFNLCCSVPDAEMSHRDYMREYGLETVRTKMVNVHGQIENEEIPEWQDLVIATKAIPRADWIRARVFSWVVSSFHFDKLLQIPAVLTRHLGGMSYREIYELFSEGRLGSTKEFPVLSSIRQFFTNKARAIQKGDTEYVHSPKNLDIYWLANEYTLIRLARGNQLQEFYREALATLTFLPLDEKLPKSALEDAIRLNSALLKRPFESEDIVITTDWNVWEFYRGVVLGKKVPLTKGGFRYHIDRTSERWDSWEAWCREVVWYGNKRSAYLYGNTPQEQLAGHY